MRLYELENITTTNYYPNPTGATGFTLSTGWNWVAVKVNVLWGFSNVTYYHSTNDL